LQFNKKMIQNNPAKNRRMVAFIPDVDYHV
jgi:hypothetical protein